MFSIFALGHGHIGKGNFADPRPMTAISLAELGPSLTSTR